jgi:hypothetical protein
MQRTAGSGLPVPLAWRQGWPSGLVAAVASLNISGQEQTLHRQISVKTAAERDAAAAAPSAAGSGGAKLYAEWSEDTTCR